MSLPEDCTDCPICGVPMLRGYDYCEGCESAAAKRLGVSVKTVPVSPGSMVSITSYTHRATGKDAYWRVAGLLSRWAKEARA